MVDIFIVDGQTMQEVELQLIKCRESLRGSVRTHPPTAHSSTTDRGYASSLGAEMDEMGTTAGLSGGDDDANTGYALVINGHSMVYALAPKLEKLFLDVGTQCESPKNLTFAAF